MLEFEQIHRDIESLSPEAQTLLVDFIQLLKNRYSQPDKKNPTTEKNLYEKFNELGLIGCCSVDQDLSTTYKEVLANALEKKYDYR